MSVRTDVPQRHVKLGSRGRRGSPAGTAAPPPPLSFRGLHPTHRAHWLEFNKAAFFKEVKQTSNAFNLCAPPLLHLFVLTQGCQRIVEDWQRILMVRSLVISPHEDMRTWLKYASLCGKSGRLVSISNKRPGRKKKEPLRIFFHSFFHSFIFFPPLSTLIAAELIIALLHSGRINQR